MEVDTTSDKVKKAQDGVLEFLLVNHPLDCPVCDKGGECPLQDQTLAYGPGESRFVEEKRHFEKPIAISDLVLLDRERCIQCGRCTRFAAEVAGEAQIDFVGRGEQRRGRHLPRPALLLVLQRQHRPDLPGGRADRDALPLHRPALGPRPGRVHLHHLLGRLPGGGAVVVQPADPPARHRLRPGQPRLAVRQGPVRLRVGQRRRGRRRPLPSWPTRRSTWPGHRVAGRQPRVTAAVPGRGTRRPLRARPPDRARCARTASWCRQWGEAWPTAAAGRRRAPARRGVIGGARLTNEAAYAWAKLAKGVIGTDSVDAQLGDGLPAELVLGLPRATIDEACRGRTVIVPGRRPARGAAVLFLRLREAVVGGDLTLVELSPDADRADPAGRGLAAPSGPATPRWWPGP